MKRNEIEKLRETVPCQALLEAAGFVIDIRESTRRAVKYRRGGEIIIVSHSGRGWFDPLCEGKGDIFGLATYLEGCDFLAACVKVAELSGFQLTGPIWQDDGERSCRNASIGEVWARRRAPFPGSAAWRYLEVERSLPRFIIRAAISQGLLREGPYGSMWAAHTDSFGQVNGWEARGPQWRGYATGGAKILFRLGSNAPNRICVTEAAIDAMSLAAIEDVRAGTLYLSTGGGWAPATVLALRGLAGGVDMQMVAATDCNSQGDIYADRLRGLAEDVGCSWLRLRPPADDWNDVLKQREAEKKEETKESEGVPHTRQPRQGKLRPAAPALDPAGQDAGGPEDVMKD